MSLFIGNKRVTFAQIGGQVITPSTEFTLYMVGSSRDRLYTLDRTTGIATRVGSATQFGVGEAGPAGLAWDGTNLYMIGAGVDALYVAVSGPPSAVGNFVRVGSASFFGVNEAAPAGLAWDGTNLYMVGQRNDALYTLDRTTGVATRVGSASLFGVNEAGASGLAWAPSPPMPS